ncbi:hypothetical protein ACK3TF_001443 [Chlorella vulgaris]
MASAGSQPPNGMEGIADALQQHLDDFSKQVAATRGSQAALFAALDTLQDQLAAAEAELPGNDATASSSRIVSLRDRIHKLNTQVSEIEHRLEGMRSHLANQASPQGPSSATPDGAPP